MTHSSSGDRVLASDASECVVNFLTSFFQHFGQDKEAHFHTFMSNLRSHLGRKRDELVLRYDGVELLRFCFDLNSGTTGTLTLNHEHIAWAVGNAGGDAMDLKAILATLHCPPFHDEQYTPRRWHGNTLGAQIHHSL